MFNVSNMNHKNDIAVFTKKKKSRLDLFLRKKNDSKNHTNVGSHVQKSGELH